MKIKKIETIELIANAVRNWKGEKNLRAERRKVEKSWKMLKYCVGSTGSQYTEMWFKKKAREASWTAEKRRKTVDCKVEGQRQTVKDQGMLERIKLNENKN